MCFMTHIRLINDSDSAVFKNTGTSFLTRLCLDLILVKLRFFSMDLELLIVLGDFL